MTTSSDAYLEGWQRSPWTVADGALAGLRPADVAATVAADLEGRWPESVVQEFLDSLSAPGTT